MEKDLQRQVVLSHKSINKKSKELSSKENKPESKSASKKKKPKKQNFQKKKKATQDFSLIRDGSEAFVLDEITNNKEASSLIQDLVKCFTRNSTLSQKEVDVLNRTLYEKTTSVLLHVLNSCVEKIFNKFLSTDFFNHLLMQKKVVKRDVFCQTIITYENYKN